MICDWIVGVMGITYLYKLVWETCLLNLGFSVTSICTEVEFEINLIVRVWEQSYEQKPSLTHVELAVRFEQHPNFREITYEYKGRI